MKTIQLTFFSDPAHGWLRVRRSLISQLGLTSRISRYSYQSPSGEWVYLEEDCDAPLLLHAATNVGWLCSITEKTTNRQAACRRYPSYQP